MEQNEQEYEKELTMRERAFKEQADELDKLERLHSTY